MAIEINIYGTKESAVSFFLDFVVKSKKTNKCSIEVKNFIDGNIENAGKQLFGKKVIFSADAGKELLNNYTVVATSENAYWEIKRFLELNFGLIEFENFEYWKTYRKKIAISFGNCHMEQLKFILQNSNSFSDEYGFYPIKPICELPESNKDYYLPATAFERCSLFLHQAIRKDNYYGFECSSENLVNKVSGNCQVICVPNIYNMPKFLFPQSYEDISGTKNNLSHNFHSFRDKYIDANYLSKSVSDLVQMIEDKNFIKSSVIQDLFCDFSKEIVEREKEWDIKVSNFILSNYKKTNLFLDPGHPTLTFFVVVASLVLEKMGINFSSSLVESKTLLSCDYAEMPLYASVFHSLDLEFSQNKFLRIKAPTRLNSNPLTIEEYVRQYILWNFWDCPKFLELS